MCGKLLRDTKLQNPLRGRGECVAMCGVYGEVCVRSVRVFYWGGEGGEDVCVLAVLPEQNQKET